MTETHRKQIQMTGVGADQSGHTTGQSLHRHQIGTPLTSAGKHRHIRLFNQMGQLAIHYARQKKNVGRYPIGSQPGINCISTSLSGAPCTGEMPRWCSVLRDPHCPKLQSTVHRDNDAGVAEKRQSRCLAPCGSLICRRKKSPDCD